MVPLFQLNRINHICFDVECIEAAVTLYHSFLGVPCKGINTMELEQGAGLVKTAFFDLGNCSIELAEHHLPPSWGQTPLKTPPGFHHIAFETPSFDKTLRQLSGQGVNPLPEFPLKTPHGWVAFLDPQQTGGILYELAEKGMSS